MLSTFLFALLLASVASSILSAAMAISNISAAMRWSGHAGILFYVDPELVLMMGRIVFVEVATEAFFGFFRPLWEIAGLMTRAFAWFSSRSIPAASRYTN
jgi:hypothetical protein